MVHTLTEKQTKFIDAYVETGNATESAKRAGYSEASAHNTGCVLLKNPEIRRRIDERNARLANIADMTVDAIVGELKAIALNPGTKDADKIRALELLGKRYGLWLDRVENNTTVSMEVEAIKRLDDEQIARLVDEQ